MRRRQGALTQLAADFGSAPLVVVTALTGLPAAALNAALPDSRQPPTEVSGA